MKRPNRPLIVTWLALAVLLLSAANLAALAGGIVRRTVLAPLDLSVPLGILIGLRVLWGVIWLAVAVGLWWCIPWARLVTLVAFPIYELVFIGQQALFAQGGYERGRLPFAIGLGLLATGIILFILTRPRVRDAFAHPAPDETKPEE